MLFSFDVGIDGVVGRMVSLVKSEDVHANGALDTTVSSYLTKKHHDGRNLAAVPVSELCICELTLFY